MDQRFLSIYEQYKDLVYNLCLHYVHRPEDAEELTQDVFVKAHQKLHTFKENSTVKTWLYRIAINTCLDFLKAQKRQRRFGFLTGLFDSETQRERPELTHHLHPGIQMEHKEGLSEIMAWINELPPTQKTAIVLMKIEGLSQKETAETMEISTKALESLIQRAKSKLRDKIEQKEKKKDI